MTRLLLITALTLIHGPVYAGWVAVEKRYQTPGVHSVYFNPDTIRRE